MTTEAQALSDPYKEAVKSWVPQVRKALEQDFAAQLERLGMKPSGKHMPLDTMKLQDETSVVRKRAEAFLSREVLAESSAERGFANVLRELTYTLLNRLVGLKAMEVRQLLFLPPLRTGCAGGADGSRQPHRRADALRYLRDFRIAGGNRYKYDNDAEEALFRDALTSAFRYVTHDIRVLFDPDHEHACVWPTHGTLVEVFRLINDGLPEDAYCAQDFLGWVYQFFNREEKSGCATRARVRPARHMSLRSSISSTPRRG